MRAEHDGKKILSMSSLAPPPLSLLGWKLSMSNSQHFCCWVKLLLMGWATMSKGPHPLSLIFSYATEPQGKAPTWHKRQQAWNQRGASHQFPSPDSHFRNASTWKWSFPSIWLLIPSSLVNNNQSIEELLHCWFSPAGNLSSDRQMRSPSGSLVSDDDAGPCGAVLIN